MENKYDIGIVGMAVMGQNLALNIESNGFKVAVYNRSRERTDEFISLRADEQEIIGCYSLKELTEVLARPRKIILMVKAGDPVDQVIDGLLPYLDEEDIIIDGGNSYFQDTDRRYARLKEEGIGFLGTGISGGEYGALHGPSIMPGGEAETYARVEDIFTAAAARTEYGPCVAYLGTGSAGHYVKMVHNGIEYGVMALISESYDFIRKVFKSGPDQIAGYFRRFNEKQQSYLLEITAEILVKEDSETGRPLINQILDQAKQKGTGKWSVQEALELGMPVPTITAAVNSRSLSSFKEERKQIGAELGGLNSVEINQQDFLNVLEEALYLAVIIAYAEGMKLLEAASAEYDYELDLAEVARIWMDGCIIRSDLLQPIRQAYQKDSGFTLISTEEFLTEFQGKIGYLRELVTAAARIGIPLPAFSSALSYFDTLRSQELPANLIQAQRDYFGAHNYQRRDKNGTFHTEWQDSEKL